MTVTRSLLADRGRLLLLMLLWAAPLVHGQKGRSEVEAGNRHFQEGEYEKARDSYRKARERAPGSSIATFNLGDSEYKLEEFTGAEKSFLEAIQSGNPEVLAAAHYNLGNSLFKQGRMEESIESYKQALRLNPSDQAAKHNLEFALRQQQEQEKQQQDQQQSPPEDQEGQDRPDQDRGESGQQPEENPSDDPENQPEAQGQEKDQDEGPKQAGEKQQQDPQQDAQQDPPSEGDKEEQKDQEPQENQADGRSDARTAPDPVEGQMTKEEADRLLQAIQEDLQSLRREQLKKLKRSRAEKDW